MKPLSQAKPSSRPQLERLELRDVPSATHLGVALPAGPVTAGGSVSVTVTALDGAGKTATDYTGTVQLTSSDGQAVLPGGYTFTAADAGQHTFTVQLQTAGTPSVLAADTADGTISGSASVSVVPAAVDHFGVQVATDATAGDPVTVTVTALDAFGNTVTDYAGTAHLDATGGLSGTPLDHAFTAADNGTFTANVALATTGTQTISATADGNLQGSAQVTVAAGAVTHFDVTGPAGASVGQADKVTVTARDQFGNVATNYTGTAVISLTDASGNVVADPVTHTFSADDAGTVALAVTPQARGTMILSVADQADPGAVGSLSVAVQYQTADQNYVATLFNQLTGHDPLYADLVHYGSELDLGVPRANVVQEIEQTPDFQTAAVTALYQNLLHRDPDQAGLNGFVSALGSGWTLDNVAAALLSSDEYFQLHGGGSNTGYVTALYQDLLGRAPDAGGLAAWTGMLDGGASRWQVARAILQSTESDKLSVIATYQQFLGRDPETPALNGYTILQRQGMTTTDLYAAILASDEYFQKAQQF